MYQCNKCGSTTCAQLAGYRMFRCMWCDGLYTEVVDG